MRAAGYQQELAGGAEISVLTAGGFAPLLWTKGGVHGAQRDFRDTRRIPCQEPAADPLDNSSLLAIAGAEWDALGRKVFLDCHISVLCL